MAIAFVVFWAAYAAIALTLGRDMNWDLRNYHFYNAWALLHGRLGWDLAPANVHSFLHPGLDIPFYLLASGPLNAWPRVLTALQAGYCAVLGTLTLALANRVCNGGPGRFSAASVLVALLGLSGAMTLSESGTTHNDVQIGCLVSGAMLGILCGAGTRRPLWLVAGGVLGGAAAGFKLTAAIYALGLALAAAIAAGPGFGGRLRAAILAGLGIAAGFLLVYLPWGWTLWQRWQTPIGPLMNSWFQSPWFLAEDLRDTRFLPRSALEAVFYPLLWVRPSIDLVTEAVFSDPRFALGLLSILVVLLCALWRRGRVHAPATLAVLAFLLLSYLAWLGAFGILRYALPLEVMMGIPVWAALRSVAALMAHPGVSARVTASALAIILACSAAMTSVPDWGRAEFGPTAGGLPAGAVVADHVALPPRSLVVMLWGAVAFAAPFLTGENVQFTGAPHPGWAGEAGLARAARDLIQSHPGPVFALLEDLDDYDHDLAARYDVPIDRERCRPVRNNLTDPLQLCRVR